MDTGLRWVLAQSTGALPWADSRSTRADPCLTDRVLLQHLLQHLGCDPALGARDARTKAEALSSPLQLLAEAKVRDDGSDLPMAVWDRDEDVTGLQVTVGWKRERSVSPTQTAA